MQHKALPFLQNLEEDKGPLQSISHVSSVFVKLYIFVEMAMTLVATARTSITEATIFSLNVEIPFTFLPIFQQTPKQLKLDSFRIT